MPGLRAVLRQLDAFALRRRARFSTPARKRARAYWPRTFSGSDRRELPGAPMGEASGQARCWIIDSRRVLNALDDHVVDVAVGVAQLPAVVVAVVDCIGEAATQPSLRRLARSSLVRETGRQRYRSRAIETIAAKLDTNDAVHEISVAATTEGRRASP